jgi:hypothetical protein
MSNKTVIGKVLSVMCANVTKPLESPKMKPFSILELVGKNLLKKTLQFCRSKLLEFVCETSGGL